MIIRLYWRCVLGIVVHLQHLCPYYGRDGLAEKVQSLGLTFPSFGAASFGAAGFGGLGVFSTDL